MAPQTIGGPFRLGDPVHQGGAKVTSSSCRAGYFWRPAVPSDSIASKITMEDDDSGGILDIELSDTEDATEKQANRTGQSEAEFQAVKADYKAKVENGDVRRLHPRPRARDGRAGAGSRG